jgi:hypothetical protein
MPAPKATGRPRVWCSDHCRRAARGRSPEQLDRLRLYRRAIAGLAPKAGQDDRRPRIWPARCTDRLQAGLPTGWEGGGRAHRPNRAPLSTRTHTAAKLFPHPCGFRVDTGAGGAHGRARQRQHPCPPVSQFVRCPIFLGPANFWHGVRRDGRGCCLGAVCPPTPPPLPSRRASMEVHDE